MVQYFTAEFFSALADALNGSQDFQAKNASVSTSLLNVAKDKGTAFLVRIEKGKVSASAAAADAQAEFTFTGDYATWVRSHKGELPLEKAIMTGAMKFKGSIPKIMGLRSSLSAFDTEARRIAVTY